jgi:hypothetical protein
MAHDRLPETPLARAMSSRVIASAKWLSTYHRAFSTGLVISSSQLRLTTGIDAGNTPRLIGIAIGRP